MNDREEIDLIKQGNDQLKHRQDFGYHVFLIKQILKSVEKLVQLIYQWEFLQGLGFQAIPTSLDK